VGAETNAPIVHVTFGTERFSQSLARLRRSARRVGIQDVRIYRPDHPAARLAAVENPEIMRCKKGAGCWIWKPYILLDAIRTVKKGTIIIYTDAGLHYIADPSPLFALLAGRDLVLFHSAANRLQRHWTKRDCFVLMQADTPKYWDVRQLDASIQIYRAGDKSRDFLQELLTAMRDPRILCDGPNTCSLPNFEGFQQHRHDQSILTILATRNGIETVTSPKRTVKLEKAAGHQPPSQNKLLIFEHHRRRNVPMGDHLRRVLRDLLE